jgi:uncharacterized membrane-anchored protein YjiN (DUF445 family)
MDNSNYTPKRLQSNTSRSNTPRSIINEEYDLQSQNNFPDLISQSVTHISQPTINWTNISKNISDEPIKELDHRNKKEIQKESVSSIINVVSDDTKIRIEKQKASYVDESGWTHIIKSTKAKYKEKKKKDTEEIDKLMQTLIKS